MGCVYAAAWRCPTRENPLKTMHTSLCSKIYFIPAPCKLPNGVYAHPGRALCACVCPLQVRGSRQRPRAQDLPRGVARARARARRLHGVGSAAAARRRRSALECVSNDGTRRGRLAAEPGRKKALDARGTYAQKKKGSEFAPRGGSGSSGSGVGVGCLLLVLSGNIQGWSRRFWFVV